MSIIIRLFFGQNIEENLNMIDRVGISTYGFTPEAQQIMVRAETLRSKLGHKELSPRHIGISLVTQYADAFGDSSTRRGIKRALHDWERRYGSSADEMSDFMEAAFQRDTNSKPISGLDLLYGLLAPDHHLPPVDPVAFLSGDELYSLVYREKVYSHAGGTIRRAHYGSTSYQVAQLALGSAETLRRTGWNEFKIIPPDLMEKVS